MTVFAFIQPDTARNVLLVLLGVGYLGYHALRWRRKRPKTEEKRKDKGEGQGEVEKVGGGGQRKVASDSAVQPHNNEIALKRECGGPAATERNLPTIVCGGEGAATPLSAEQQLKLAAFTSDLNHSPADDTTGEALFDQARALPHQVIPDFRTDGPYLDLLGKSAAAGYAPALAKLGEYAMRRAAWVEAYYWMSMAKRQGMQGLTVVMREIRKNWSLDGFPDEEENVNRLFTLEAGSIGRALIHVDSGHEAAKAKAFLKANHPEFLTCR